MTGDQQVQAGRVAAPDLEPVDGRQRDMDGPVRLEGGVADLGPVGPSGHAARATPPGRPGDGRRRSPRRRPSGGRWQHWPTPVPCRSAAAGRRRDRLPARRSSPAPRSWRLRAGRTGQGGRSGPGHRPGRGVARRALRSRRRRRPGRRGPVARCPEGGVETRRRVRPGRPARMVDRRRRTATTPHMDPETRRAPPPGVPVVSLASGDRNPHGLHREHLPVADGGGASQPAARRGRSEGGCVVGRAPVRRKAGDRPRPGGDGRPGDRHVGAPLPQAPAGTVSRGRHRDRDGPRARPRGGGPRRPTSGAGPSRSRRSSGWARSGGPGRLANHSNSGWPSSTKAAGAPTCWANRRTTTSPTRSAGPAAAIRAPPTNSTI